MSTMEALLTRQPSTDKQTLGELVLYPSENVAYKAVFSCKTLELPWKNNQRNISCIPTGIYDVVPRSNAKFGQHYHILNIPNRSFVLIHTGNFYTQIEGCILVGSAHLDINHDGIKDVVSSRNTLDQLLKYAPNGFRLIIR